VTTFACGDKSAEMGGGRDDGGAAAGTGFNFGGSTNPSAFACQMRSRPSRVLRTRPDRSRAGRAESSDDVQPRLVAESSE